MVSNTNPVVFRTALALAVAVSGCTRAPDGGTPQSSLPAAEPTVPVGGSSSVGPPTSDLGGDSSGGAMPVDPSGMQPSGAPSGGAMPVDPSTMEAGGAPSGGAMPVDPSTMGAGGEPSGGGMPVDPSTMGAGGEPSGGAMPVDETTEPVTAEVPDPVFEAPWFPCPEQGYPEGAVVVKTHDKVVHTSSSTQIDAEVELPEGSFKAVALRVELECPTGGICDLYDRLATFELVNQTDAGEETLALMRYVTTYRFNEGQTNYMCSFSDVTPYASMLTGTQTIRSWLDTVVSPGDDLGDGWQVSAELVFYPGPAPDPLQVTELYGHFINIGEAPGSIDEQTPATTVEIPPDVTQVVAQLTVTGHGWGPENTDNCAEFCRLDQTLSINGGTPHVVNPFRDDCGQNPLAPLQQRNPTGSRNGWCPGSVVLPHRIDITDEVTPGMPAQIDFGVQRPDGGEYIDADETGYNPNELVSLQLFMSTGAP